MSLAYDIIVEFIGAELYSRLRCMDCIKFEMDVVDDDINVVLTETIDYEIKCYKFKLSDPNSLIKMKKLLFIIYDAYSRDYRSLLKWIRS